MSWYCGTGRDGDGDGYETGDGDLGRGRGRKILMESNPKHMQDLSAKNGCAKFSMYSCLRELLSYISESFQNSKHILQNAITYYIAHYGFYMRNLLGWLRLGWLNILQIILN